MPPRFMERMKRQSDTLLTLFGEPQFDPPPYPSSSRSSRADSAASSQHGSVKSPPPVYARDSTLIPYSSGQADSWLSEGGTHGLEKLAISRDSLVLVTGANSWLGTHVVDQLLEQGYRVRGTVRSAEKGAWGLKYFADKYGTSRYTTIVVPDMAQQGAFDMAVRDCSGIIHIASVTTPSPDPNEVITPTIAGAIGALESATKDANIKRFVLCSSVSAAVSHYREVRNEITSASWNMLDFEDAWAKPPYEYSRVAAVAASSKMQTEAAVWRWYTKHQPYFVLNTVLPDTLIGTTLNPASLLPPSTALLKSLHRGQNFSSPPSHAVDVTDAALLLVASLILRDVTQQRTFAVSTPCNALSLAALLNGLYPGREIGTNVPACGSDLTVFVEQPKAGELLRRMGKQGWTSLEQSVQEACLGFT